MIKIKQTIRFLTPDASRQSGKVCGFIHRDGIDQLIIAVTAGPDTGRTVYLSEEWVIL